MWIILNLFLCGLHSWIGIGGALLELMKWLKNFVTSYHVIMDGTYLSVSMM